MVRNRRFVDVTGRRCPPLGGCMSQRRGRPSGDRTKRCGGPPLGELSGGNWMAVVDGRLFTGAARSPVGRGFSGCLWARLRVPSQLVLTKFCPFPYGGDRVADVRRGLGSSVTPLESAPRPAR